MNRYEFPKWFQQQAVIQNEVQHILCPEWTIHDTEATKTAASFYRQMARETQEQHDDSMPNQLFNQALIAITGFAVTANHETALQVAQETNIINLATHPGMTAAIGMMVPELKQQAATILQRSPHWRRILKAADNPYREPSELLQLCKEAATKEDYRILDSAVRWAVAAVKIRRQTDAGQPDNSPTPDEGH